MNPGERLFQPDVEGGLGPLLFENFSDLTTSRIESKIRQAIGKFEPRADVQSVNVKPSPEQNAYLVNIVYIPDNDIQETTPNSTLRFARANRNYYNTNKL